MAKKYLKNASDTKAKIKSIKRHSGGRPRVVTDELKAAMLGVIRKGVAPSLACAAVGVSESWMKNEIKTNPDWEADVQSALQLFKLQHLKSLDKHSEKYWQASAWLLERTFPEEYNVKIAQLKIEQDKEKSAPNWFGTTIEDAVVVGEEDIKQLPVQEEEEVVVKKKVNHNLKVTNEQVEEIRKEYKRGKRRKVKVSYSQLAKQYGVSKTTICKIINKDVRN
jgi:DNA-binding XRE family transcriptional regulator